MTVPLVGCRIVLFAQRLLRHGRPFLDTMDLFSITFGERRARGITRLEIALPPSVMTLRPIQVVACTSNLLLSIVEYPMVYAHRSLAIHLLKDIWAVFSLGLL